MDSTIAKINVGRGAWGSPRALLGWQCHCSWAALHGLTLPALLHRLFDRHSRAFFPHSAVSSSLVELPARARRDAPARGKARMMPGARPCGAGGNMRQMRERADGRSGEQAPRAHGASKRRPKDALSRAGDAVRKSPERLRPLRVRSCLFRGSTRLPSRSFSYGPVRNGRLHRRSRRLWGLSSKRPRARARACRPGTSGRSALRWCRSFSATPRTSPCIPGIGIRRSAWRFTSSGAFSQDRIPDRGSKRNGPLQWPCFRFIIRHASERKECAIWLIRYLKGKTCGGR